MEQKNDTFLRALNREDTEYTPIWLMRQAGRFLPEYRRVREACGSFMALARNPRAATEVTLQPVDRFGLDAAILFSDILTVPDAMGLGLDFVPGQGPRFARPVQDEAAVASLYVPDPTRELRYVIDAVSSIRRALNNRIPLIGFSGSPFTLACYMVEGCSSRDFPRTKEMLYRRPDLLNRILQINTQAVAQYLLAQIEAGAQALQLFDTWGGILSGPAFELFSLQPIRNVIGRIRRDTLGRHVPIIVFTKGGGQWLEALAGSGADCIGVDWTVNLAMARDRTKGVVCLQGNMDPTVLLAGDQAIEKEAHRVLDEFGTVDKNVGHVFNLGHGILQSTPPEAVATLVQVVQAYSRRYHRKKEVLC